jgi:PPE-repeat protein
MPGDPRWTGPPEAIAATFEAGSSASVMSNNLVWVTETAQHELSMGLSAVNTSATLGSWQGLGAIASAVAATGLNAGLQTMAGWTAHKITVTQGAVDAFTTAQSSVIPSVVSQTNRDEWTVLNATNIIGQNTPAIAERDLEYFGEHWPHNSSVGWAYSSALSALTTALAIPPPIASMGASPAAPAAASTAVSEAAATTGAEDGVSLSSQAAEAAGETPASSASGLTSGLSSVTEPLQSAVSSATQPLSGLSQAPMQAAQSATSMPQSLMQSMGGMFPSAMAQDAAQAEAVAGSLGAGGGAAGGVGGGAGGAGVGGFPGAGLTSYTRPTSTFEPATGGRPTGLRAGVLNAAEVHSPTTSAGAGGGAMPMAPAGLAGRGGANSDKAAVSHARIVVDGDPTEPC